MKNEAAVLIQIKSTPAEVDFFFLSVKGDFLKKAPLTPKNFCGLKNELP